jgi:hypothetical protein
MRLLFSLVAGAVLSVVLLAACNSTETKGNKAANAGAGAGNKQTVSLPTGPEVRTPQTTPADGVRRITTVELRDALEKGQALVVDVRPADSYKQRHIKGSINIPLEQVAARVGELPRDKIIVTYCS